MLEFSNPLFRPSFMDFHAMLCWALRSHIIMQPSTLHQVNASGITTNLLPGYVHQTDQAHHHFYSTVEKGWCSCQGRYDNLRPRVPCKILLIQSAPLLMQNIYCPGPALIIFHLYSTRIQGPLPPQEQHGSALHE